MHLSQRAMQDLVERFLDEDIGFGDITTLATVPETAHGHGRLIAKAPLVVAGLDAARIAFQTVDARVQWQSAIQDGMALQPGGVVAQLDGPGRALLTAERVALNLLQRLSGVATLTRRYVEAVQHTQARVIDTRKTTPGLRALEKYAVRVGGGHNHRFGLADGVLIKDNHIAIVGSIEKAVARVREHVSHLQKIEVEVDRIDQIPEALMAGVDAILLDNMSPGQTREAVALVRSKPGGERILLESSGGVTLETVRAYAEAGVNLISSGALTHSAPAVDISLDMAIS
ncbi:MAG: nicotinate-nucleotide pyrophosphorylase [Candidatus Entotheonella factor]|uniref:Probable nicotinate-nucleotide pyrophosphorylase [carboxylating] n=1 Tax=Entotheonella factor TaxID=1429438 RepID=W4LU44_ENTF1|nr:carboxylating nicotinate-nucleotide diphosphorylase [Candidatus Entotheonella palauensis]ETX00942.1 MAG: nicotinate-nucleotide pyrophosphorylase [Candidatus Entotheonella factor]